MKYKIIIASVIFSFVYSVCHTQTTYYVSNEGLNSNNGTSENTPWQTISKLNNSTFQPGDQILFKSGQEFLGKLIVSSSGNSNSVITFGKYGGDDRPTINGRNYQMCINASGEEHLLFTDLILKNDANEDTTQEEQGADKRRYGFYAHVDIQA